MLTVRVTQEVNAPAWNSRVDADPHGAVFQTVPWAGYQAAYLGDTPHFLTVSDGAEVIGELLVLETLRGQESVLAGGRRWLRRVVTPLLKTLQWRQGPVVTQPERRAEVLRMCLDATEMLAGQRGVTGIEEASIPIGCEDMRLAAVFAEYAYRAEPRATIVVDVSQPVEQLWEGLRSEARTRVRKAQKQGVTVRRLDGAEDLCRFHELVTAWRQAAGFPPYAAARYEQMVRHLGSHCAIFLAEHEGASAAGAGILHLGDRGYVFTPVQSLAVRDLGAGDLLHWELLRWSHERGLTTLDLAGVAPEPRSEKERGIRRFKEKWGGRLVEYTLFSKPLKPASWALTSFVRTVRRSAHALGVWR
jgi:hypothetical protein